MFAYFAWFPSRPESERLLMDNFLEKMMQITPQVGSRFLYLHLMDCLSFLVIPMKNSYKSAQIKDR